MQLLYITNGVHGSGGLERVLSIKTNYLIEKLNYKVAIVTLNSPTTKFFYPFNAKVSFYDVSVKGNPLSYYFSYKRGIQDVIKNFKPDIVTVCDDGLKGVMFPYLINVKKPLVYERHASLKFNFIREKSTFFSNLKSTFSKSIMRFGAKKFDKFVVLTNGNVNDWKGVKCNVIPNPSPFKSTTGILEDRGKIVLTVGTQSFNKGYDRLIKVWALISKDYPEWKLKIFGKQKTSLNLQGLVNSLKLENSVSLHDPIKNIEEEYKKASIFALSSRSEGFGMVLIEAMSFGLPCVAFNCPYGPKDIISNKEDGFLVDNNDLVGFQEKISYLIENKEERVRMGKNSKDNIKRYSIPQIMEKWNKLYTSLI